MKPVILTTNTAIYLKIETPSSYLFKYVSLLIYDILETITLKVKLSGYLQDPKNHIRKLPVLQNLLYLEINNS